MKTMNRRAALRVLTGTATALAGPALVAVSCAPTEAAAAGVTPALAAAMKRHRRLYSACLAAETALEDCCEAHEAEAEANPIRYVTSIGPMQLFAEGHRHPDVFGNSTPAVFQDARRERIRQGFVHSPSKSVKRWSDEALAKANATYQADLDAMAAAYAEDAARWQARNGPELDDANDAAGAAEGAAWDSFIAEPALTSSDVRAKVEYVLATERLSIRVSGGRDGEALVFIRSLAVLTMEGSAA